MYYWINSRAGAGSRRLGNGGAFQDPNGLSYDFKVVVAPLQLYFASYFRGEDYGKRLSWAILVTPSASRSKAPMTDGPGHTVSRIGQFRRFDAG
jgi:hypothetical protein